MNASKFLRVALACALAAQIPFSAAAAELSVGEAPSAIVPVVALPQAPIDAPVFSELPALGALTPAAALEVNLAAVSPAATARAAARTAAATAKASAAKTRASARPALAALTETLSPSRQARTAAPLGARLNALYDQAAARRADLDAAPVAAPVFSAASEPLKPADGRPASPRRAAVPSAARTASRTLLRFAPAALALALVFLAPGAAFAQTAAGPVTVSVASSLGLLAGLQPLVSAGGALVGAAYGLFASRSKDGTEPSAGDVLASVLRYGALGGVGSYALLDLTQLAFIGPSIGLKPLSAAVATAAFGRSAFQGKFSDPAATSADRIVGAFPAVAAALGLSIGINLMAAPVLTVFQVATGAMAATGVASALYAALYKPGRSFAEGPSLMGKGYVLQALMSGMALAVSGWLFWPFAALGAAGFALVLYSFGRELLTLIPKAPAAPK